MCEYCEKDKRKSKVIKSCNFCGSAKMVVSVSDEMTILEVQGDKEKFSLFKRIYCPRFDINYCPICRKKIKRGIKIMEQWLRDALAEEQGYVICSLAPYQYIHCDEKCEKCEYYIDFIEALKERKEDKR